MSLAQTIKLDLNQAIKEKKPEVVSTLRMFSAALQNRQIALRKTAADINKELSEEEIIAVLKSEIKKRQEAIEAYTVGGRPELVAKEQAEAVLLQTYLPPQLSEEEVKKIVVAAIAQSGASGAKDFGKVMPLVMAQVKGKAEGSLVSKLVKELLGVT